MDSSTTLQFLSIVSSGNDMKYIERCIMRSCVCVCAWVRERKRDIADNIVCLDWLDPRAVCSSSKSNGDFKDLDLTEPEISLLHWERRGRGGTVKWNKPKISFKNVKSLAQRWECVCVCVYACVCMRSCETKKERDRLCMCKRETCEWTQKSEPIQTLQLI